ncbi:MAG: insulinase family protein [Alphaproteobacteria bacterium]|nr:insulinase family protein [Alphaproteobacteria bacterium]
MSGIKTTTLSNGLRIVTDSVESMHSAAVGIWSGVGTRHEDMRENGAAHMVEHMLFKGTKTRNALQIAAELEDLGGAMNAYTGREVTSYHVHLLAEDALHGLDVLADMYLNSTLPDEEIERERDVIIQEIGMCNDTPDDLVFDIFAETAYPGQTLGAPILGSIDNIKSMRREDLRSYIERFYAAPQTIISIAGGVNHEECVAKVESLFDGIADHACTAPKTADYQGGETRLQKDLEQSHFILGFEGISRLDKDYYAAQALSSILGGGMASRLFQEVREKRGLVYSVFSYHSAYQDAGQFGIYAGTDPQKMGEIMPVICDEVLKSTQDITEDELTRAKAQLKASLLMGRESMMSRADHQAKYMLFRGGAYDLDKIIASIEALQVNDVTRIAAQIFKTAPTLAALGPLEKLESYGRLQERLAA